VARRKVKGAVRVYTDIPADELMEAASDSLDRDELFAFIVALDRVTADYDFTKKLARHFAREIAAEKEAAKSTPDRGEGAS
jgi:hypothetical protein